MKKALTLIFIFSLCHAISFGQGISIKQLLGKWKLDSSTVLYSIEGIDFADSSRVFLQEFYHSDPYYKVFFYKYKLRRSHGVTKLLLTPGEDDISGPSTYVIKFLSADRLQIQEIRDNKLQPVIFLRRVEQ